MTAQTDAPDCHFPDGKLACSITKFADLTDLGRSTIYQAIRDGSLTARKMGKRTVITAPDGMQWLRSLPPANSAAAA
jgi:excisionase family DNA binding protein